MLEARAAELQNKAQEMAKYYYKGFGDSISGIASNPQTYLKHPERTYYSEDAYQWIKQIEDFYAKIPFNTLHGKEEFYPFFIMKELLPEVRKKMDEVFKEKNNGSCRTLEIFTKTITTVGGVYRKNLKKLFDEIRTISGEDNFCITITDHKGEKWYFIDAP